MMYVASLIVNESLLYLARITNEDVRRRCGVENLEHRLRKTRLRWFVHVKCRNENSILRRAVELEVDDRRPSGRPKKRKPGVKQWKKT